MTGRPVIRTYGKARPPASSSSGISMIFESSPPSSPLLTPHASSDALDSIPALKIMKNEEKENIAPKKSIQQSTLRGFFTIPPKTTTTEIKKRPFESMSENEINGTPSGSKTSVGRGCSSDKDKTKESLTQLHLTHLPLLHTCQACQMSYVRGGEDESLHERHHARVVRGAIWDGLGKGSRSAAGKDKGKERDLGWRVVKDNVGFGTKGTGRIIMADGPYGGANLDDILKTVDTVLSSPPLPLSILTRCKIFLFVTASPAPSKRLRPGFNTDRKPKERVVGVVVAQGIKWAMRVMTTDEQVSADGSKQVVDSGDGVMCDPRRLETPLGIHRVFTIPSYRSLGLAQMLLDAACRYTVYGCSFDPLKGQVAFSQPTNSGRGVMTKWGQGQVRVFVDDESQL